MPDSASSEVPSKPDILHFNPPVPVYLISSEDGGAIIEPLLDRGLLTNLIRAGIPNPWKEGRFIAGIVYGEGNDFFLDVGLSFGALEFYEETGWGCKALIHKNYVMSGVLSEKASKGTFTEKLLKRPKKAKKTGTKKTPKKG